MPLKNIILAAKSSLFVDFVPKSKIDRMVYDLYGLTEEEIIIIENS
jgi:hypothetical protein